MWAGRGLVKPPQPFYFPFMVFTLSRSGGFAGIARPPLTVDSADLARPAAKRLESLVAAAGFFDLPAQLKSKPAQADRFQFTLSVKGDEGAEHTVAFSEEAASSELSALVAALQAVKK